MGKRDEKVAKDKKPFFKKWWFWAIIAVVVIIGSTGNSESNSSTDNKNETKTVAKKESVADKKERLKKEAEEEAEAERSWKEAAIKVDEAIAKQAAEKAQAEKQAAEKAAKEAADRDPNSYQALPYEEMARNGNNHKGEKLQITGKVIQVMDSDKGFATLRVATRDGYEDVYLVQIPADQWKSHRLLEDDVITFYGEVYGLYSYSSTMGGKITVPAINVNMY